MSKLAPQTKTFIILFFVAVFGAFLCLSLWSNLAKQVSNRSNNTNTIIAAKSTAAKTVPAPAPAPAVDTTGWKTYTNKQEQLSFLYKPGWKVLPAVNKDGFTVLQVDPGPKFYNIKIYVSPKEFYIMDGVPATNETIDGQPALNADYSLYGIKANNLYYTFDVGLSMSLVPDFDGLVYSVKFEN